MSDPLFRELEEINPDLPEEFVCGICEGEGMIYPSDDSDPYECECKKAERITRNIELDLADQK